MVVWIVVGSLAASLGLTAAVLAIVVTMGGGKRKGWKALAAAYPVPPDLGTIQVWPKQTVQVGAVQYRQGVQVGVLGRGLYLATGYFRLPPLFIPWTALSAPEPKRLYGRPGLAFGLAEPVDTRIVVYEELGRRFTAHLPRAQRR